MLCSLAKEGDIVPTPISGHGRLGGGRFHTRTLSKDVERLACEHVIASVGSDYVADVCV